MDSGSNALEIAVYGEVRAHPIEGLYELGEPTDPGRPVKMKHGWRCLEDGCKWRPPRKTRQTVEESGIRVQWEAPKPYQSAPPLSAYLLVRAVDNATAFVEIACLSGDTLEYLDEDVRDDLGYRYLVRAHHGDGDCQSAEFSYWTWNAFYPVVPGRFEPRKLRSEPHWARDDASSVQLTWDAPKYDAESVDGYQVVSARGVYARNWSPGLGEGFPSLFQEEVNRGYSEQVKVIGSVTRANTSYLDNGNAYHWAVRAWRDANSNGQVEDQELSGYSGYVSHWIGHTATETTEYGRPPGRPGKVSVTPSERQLRVSWEAPADNGGQPANSYLVEWRKEFPDHNDGDSKRSAATETTIDHLGNGVTYIIVVTAQNDFGDGLPSEEVSAAPGAGGTGLDTPIIQTPEALHHRMVQLEWQDVEGADGYEVQFHDHGAGDWVDLPTGDVAIVFNGSSAVVSGLPENRLWWFQARAVNSAGPSEWSEIVQVFPTKASDWESEGGNSPATGLPAVSGTAQVGETLTADTSGITDADGLEDATFSYQWIASGGNMDADIQDATDSTYILTDNDAGKAVKVRVSFTDYAGSQETLTSAATGPVAYAEGPPGTPQDVEVDAGDEEITVSW